MEVTNCKTCGRLFNVLGSERICPNCKAQLEDKFQEVKKFLEENPNSSVEVVSKETEVSSKQIRQWVREERLVLSEGVDMGIACEKCGKAINTGRFCPQCKSNLTNTLASALDRPQAVERKKVERDGNKMRFLRNE